MFGKTKYLSFLLVESSVREPMVLKENEKQYFVEFPPLTYLGVVFKGWKEWINKNDPKILKVFER